MITPPTFAAANDYGDRLGDVGFWRPYAQLALERSELSENALQSGFVGTYPTLLGNELVIKLFGHFGDWCRSVEAELAANRTIARDDRILAPRVIANGELFPGREDCWPYLISERLDGIAWREAALTPEERSSVAGQLGRQSRIVHQQVIGARGRVRDDQRPTGVEAADRHRRWAHNTANRSLPDRLIAQIPSYLEDYRGADPVLVHADLTEDHIFVRDGALVGVIDWGDAMSTDPYYELGALHLGAFAADRRLLGSFLDGYGWPVDSSFVRHAMQVALMHEFDLFGGVADLADRSDSLDELAALIWQPR